MYRAPIRWGGALAQEVSLTLTRIPGYGRPNYGHEAGYCPSAWRAPGGQFREFYQGGYMGILRAVGILLIVAWIVLWLFVKITLVAIHLLLLLGLAAIIIDLVRPKSA